MSELLRDYTRTVSTLPKGTAFTRFAIALAVGRGSLVDAEQVAVERYGRTSPEVARVIRSALDAGGTQAGNWAAQLAVTPMMQEFLEVLRPQTIVGRMQGVQRHDGAHDCRFIRLLGEARGAKAGIAADGR